MNIADIIAAERVTRIEDAQSKKRALEQLAELLAEGSPYLTAGEVFSGLVAREKLGCTAIGGGVAIPHARMKSIDEAIGAFAHFPGTVAYDANDERPVDLMFGLLVPEQSTQTHLDLLRALAELFSQPQYLADLRNASDDKVLLDALLKHGAATPTATASGRT